MSTTPMMHRIRRFWWVVLVVHAVQAQETPVERYVRQKFAHGVPYQQSLRWSGDADVQRLTELLNDEGEHRHWVNIVTVLGIAGQDEAFCPLVEFLSRNAQSPRDEEAVLSVPLALGYLVNAKGTGANDSAKSAAAFRILIAGVDPAFWGDPWRSESQGVCHTQLQGVSSEEVRRALARRTILGLALSGQHSAVVLLKRISAEVTGGGGWAEIYSDLLPEMAETAGKIEADGLERYYRESNN